ncbi:hypothetical protein LCGC14_0414140 [marine sediment metagenome]|uniref:Bbp19-like phage domain-containing protein n=1 Tax=marine sediment metagenome TaxID=412755 RepID=A0A0F9W226_9ZZZZ
MPGNEASLNEMALRDVLNSESGRRVLARILKECDVEGTSYRDGSDSHWTAYREGQRSVGRVLRKWMVKTSDVGYLKVIQREILKDAPQ